MEALWDRVYAAPNRYCKRKQGDAAGGARFAKILLRLPALRSLGLKCAEHMFFYKLIKEDGRCPPQPHAADAGGGGAGGRQTTATGLTGCSRTAADLSILGDAAIVDAFIVDIMGGDNGSSSTPGPAYSILYSTKVKP